MSKPMNQVVEMPPLDTEATVEVLNRILHLELNGVMQQSQHLWMAGGSSRRGRAPSPSVSRSRP